MPEFDLWVERERPDEAIRGFVLAWIQSRMDDPYAEVLREGQVDNLWYGPIPRTVGTDGRVVVGSYFVFESQKLVRCNSFGTLGLPL